MRGSDEMTNESIARALGEELRRTREARGWSRLDLTGRLPSGIGEQTLLTYEHGSRHCTFVRLVEICRILGVATPDVVQRVLQRAGVDLENLSLRVDLRAVLRDKNAEFRPVRRWARNRLAEDPEGAGIVRLVPDGAREIAAVIGCPRSALVTYLAAFAPEIVPLR